MKKKSNIFEIERSQELPYDSIKEEHVFVKGLEMPLKSKFKNHYNVQWFPLDEEKNFGPSCTVPDQSMSIREIMDRFARGLPLGGEKVPIWNGEDDDVFDGVDPRTLDLSEKEDLLRSTKTAIADYQQKGEREFHPVQQRSLDPAVSNNPDPKAKLPAEGEKEVTKK